jgi:hypothetical protein
VYLRTGSDFRSHSSQAQPTSKIHKQKLHRSSHPLAPHHPNSEGTTWSVSRRPPGLFLFNSYQHMAMGRKLNTKTRIFSTNSVTICALQLLQTYSPVGCSRARQYQLVESHWGHHCIGPVSWSLAAVAGESERGMSPQVTPISWTTTGWLL